jgi:uncharacterized membrane protein
VLTGRVRTAAAAGDDAGQLSVLVLGYAAIAALLVIVGMDASAAFLARRALVAAADDAAIAAAEAVDTSAVYAGGLQCGRPLPLDAGRASADAAESVAADTDLHHSFAAVDAPVTTVAGATVTVAVTGHARLPLSGVLALLDPPARTGVAITATSHAQSPTVAPGGC